MITPKRKQELAQQFSPIASWLQSSEYNTTRKMEAVSLRAQGLPMERIARMMGVSYMRVRQILEKTIEQYVRCNP